MAVQKPLYPGVVVNFTLFIALGIVALYTSGFNVSSAFEPLIPHAIESLAQVFVATLIFTSTFKALGSYDEDYINIGGAFLSIALFSLITFIAFSERGFLYSDDAHTYKIVTDIIFSISVFSYTFGSTMRFLGMIRSLFCILLSSILMIIIEIGVRSVLPTLGL